MRKNKKYGSYHGRKSYGKMLIASFLILVIVVSLGYFFWGDHNLSLAIFPRFDHAEQVEEVIEPEVELIIDDPVVETVEEVRTGLLLSTDATIWAEQDVSSFDTVAFVAKDSAGKFYYPTTTDAVYGAVADTASDNGEYVTQLLAGESHTIAMLSVFSDPLYTSYYVTASALMSNTGYGYKDGDSKVWLDPGKDDAQQWVLSIVDELIAMGVDEIMLTEFHYPQTGTLENIRYSTEDPAQTLTDFLAEICARTQDAGVTLGMEMSPGALVSGSVPYEDWTALVDTFYAATNDMPTAISLVGDAVVELSEQVPVSGSYLLTP